MVMKHIARFAFIVILMMLAPILVTAYDYELVMSPEQYGDGLGRIGGKKSVSNPKMAINPSCQKRASVWEYRSLEKGAVFPFKSRLTVGHVLTSPDPHKTCYRAKDLIYIRIRPSSSNIMQVGDRYGLEPEKVSNTGGDCCDNFGVSFPVIAGEVEIICVGEDTALGVILKSYASISRGGSVCRMDDNISVQPGSQEFTSDFSAQASKF
jgi:hypothetical protein